MSDNAGKNNNGLKIVIIVGVVIIVALLGIILALLMKKDNQVAEQPQEEKRAVVVKDEASAEKIAEEMVTGEYVAPGYYEVSMTTDWHFPSGDAESTDAYVENVKTNTNDVYFDLFLSGDEENAIYESPIIPLGAELEQIKLDKSLAAGTYDCVMIYHLVDENQKSLSELRIGLTIFVEN